MGDHWAPSIAQSAHENVLLAYGALTHDEHLVFDQITPRAPLGHYSGVCIDDKVSVQLVPKSPLLKDKLGPLRDEEACALADQAYNETGLTAHPKKRQRRASVYSAWGAQIEGRVGFLGAKRDRLLCLSTLTAVAARSPAISRVVLDSLLGSWAFCFQFRRCLFSIFARLYVEGPPNGKYDSPFKLSSAARTELLLAAVLGPLALAQLRYLCALTCLQLMQVLKGLAWSGVTLAAKWQQNCIGVQIEGVFTPSCFRQLLLTFRNRACQWSRRSAQMISQKWPQLKQ